MHYVSFAFDLSHLLKVLRQYKICLPSLPSNIMFQHRTNGGLLYYTIFTESDMSIERHRDILENVNKTLLWVVTEHSMLRDDSQ